MKNKIGLDLVNNKPDYNKTIEENRAIIKKRYENVYGKAEADKVFKSLENDDK